jgi:hypothetical protein
MKKQIIAAAVATSVSAIAMADVSITGNANYEYFSKESTTNYNTNYSDTEINLSVKGKSGDTSVVANFEIDSHGDASSALDIEDTYITTKVGDFTVKAGNYASGTTALGGEIDQGGRATDKVDISTMIGDIKVGYAVSADSNEVYNTDGAAVYASIPVAGWTVGVKDNSDSYTIMGATGSVGGFDIRVENKDNDSSTTGDALFYDIRTKVGDVTVGYAAIDADKAGTASTADAVTEGDSSVFAQEMATDSTSAGKTGVDGVSQVMASTTVDGTTFTVKVGELRGGKVSGTQYQDAGFSRIDAKRKLASGATLVVSYDDYESTVASGSVITDTQVFEIDLSIAF